MDIRTAFTFLPCTITHLAKEAGIPYATLQKKLSGKDSRYKITYADKVALLTALRGMLDTITAVRDSLKKSALMDLKEEYERNTNTGESSII